MRVCRNFGIGVVFWSSLVWCLLAASRTESAPAPSAESIIQRTLERAADSRSRTADPGYTYTKKNITEEFDGKGKVKERKERMFKVYFRAGTTYVRLLEVNGQPPAQADVKLQSETQSSVHQYFGQSASGGDSRDTFLTQEVASRYDYTLVGKSSFNGRPTYQITFQPKTPELPVRKMMDRLLNHVSGTLWIDAEEFEIARADIQLSSEVEILGGVIGCLRKLAYSMTRTRVAEGVWLHSFSTGDFEGRKLLEPMRIRMKSECSNFRLTASAG